MVVKELILRNIFVSVCVCVCESTCIELREDWTGEYKVIEVYFGFYSECSRECMLENKSGSKAVIQDTLTEFLMRHDGDAMDLDTTHRDRMKQMNPGVS